MNVREVACVSLSACALWSAEAAAQSATTSSAPTDEERAQQPDAQAPGDIVVTANRRPEPLSQVPAAVSAIGAAQLEVTRTVQVADLDGKIPSFRFTRFNLADTHLTIRGIGSNIDSAALDRSVAIFVDDVYIGRAAAAASDIFDLERVEVLRGPQGTLYGKNVVGGAINYVTPTPGQDFRGKIRIGAGNLDSREAAMAASGGLGNDWAAGFATAYREVGGYTRNLSTGNLLDDQRSVSARTTLAYDGAAARLKLTGDYAQVSGNAPGFFPLYDGTSAVAGISARWRTGINPRAIYLGPDGDQRITTYGVTVKAEWDVGGGTLTSISAARGSHADTRIGYLGSNTPRTAAGLPTRPQTLEVRNRIDERASQYSEELRYRYQADALDLLLGAFAMRENVDRAERSDQLTSVALFRADRRDGHTSSYAAFADLTWRFAPGFELDGGLRYTIDRRDFGLIHTGTGGYYGTFPVPAPGPFILDQRGTWKAWTPKVSLKYQLAPGLNAYALISRGFKSGGFDGEPTNVLSLRPVAPEYVWNYEGGIKGSLLGSRVYVELAGFHMDYTDLQVLRILTVSTVPLITATFLENAAGARINGVEGTLRARLGGGFEVGGTLSYLDTAITRSDTPTIEVGNVLPNAPKFSYSLSAGYTRDIGRDLRLRANIDYSHFARSFQKAENLASAVRPAYGVLNGSISLGAAGPGLTVSVWGKNLTDETYVNYIISSEALGGEANFAPPRTYGVTLGYSF